MDKGGEDTATLDIFTDDQTGSGDVVLTGNIASTTGGSPISSGGGSSTLPAFNTLDEPIRDTIIRDLKAVGSKFYHVLFPFKEDHKLSLLREWDLWGPLILCTFMATVLQGHDTSTTSGDGDGGPEFAEVFVIVWMGAMIVTLNTKLLGGNISFFQSVCVLGYCLLPLGVSLLFCRIVLLAGKQGTVLFLMRAASVLAGLVWSVFASMQFLGDCQPKSRKALALYPIFLFYFIISWLVISHSN